LSRLSIFRQMSLFSLSYMSLCVYFLALLAWENVYWNFCYILSCYSVLISYLFPMEISIPSPL
jgi:hypothetical protein